MKLWLSDVVKLGFKSSLIMLLVLVLSLVFTDTALTVLKPVAALIFGDSS